MTGPYPDSIKSLRQWGDRLSMGIDIMHDSASEIFMRELSRVEYEAAKEVQEPGRYVKYRDRSAQRLKELDKRRAANKAARKARKR